MQQRHKQLAAQYQLNSYNKLNYHLKKVQPFRNKPKRTVTQQMKQYSRNEKVSTIPTNKTLVKKPLVKQEQFEQINEEHVNNNMIIAASHVKIYAKADNNNRRSIFDRGSSENRLQKLNVAQRGKSLKYWKVEKPQPNLLTHIKGFFNTFLSQSDDGGCNCGTHCQCKQVLLKWINVPNELIKSNYSKLLNIAYKKQLNKRQNYGETRMSSWSQNYDQDEFQSKAQRLQRVKHQVQIQKDVIRTQTQNRIFHQKQVQQKMQRILMCYTVEDPEVGYVQSMNIVMSGVLYHVRDQAQTYAICRRLFHQIRKIYLNDFKQCYRHVDFIIKLLQQHVLDLYNHLEQHGVDLRVVIFPWILSLLCVIVPLQHLHLIYIGFVKKSWNFIYKIILALFVYHKQKIKQMDECGDILVFLSSSNENQRQKIDWLDIAKFAQYLSEYF